MIPLADPIIILMVEDNEGDAFLTKELLKEAKVSNVIHIVRDGVEAMGFLHKEGMYSGAPTPDLILLDLKMPRMDGHEVLARIRADPKLECIPVVILTSSEADEDVLRAYKHKANCYVTKPVGLEQFSKIVRSIDDFWLSIVKLPTRLDK